MYIYIYIYYRSMFYTSHHIRYTIKPIYASPLSQEMGAHRCTVGMAET